MKEYRPAKKRISVSVGESVRIIRELQELSQNKMDIRNHLYAGGRFADACLSQKMVSNTAHHFRIDILSV